MRIHPYFLIILFTLVVFSCRQSGNQPEVVEAGFNVDQELLATDTMTDTGLSFQMQYPAGWTILDESFRKQLTPQILVGSYSPARIVSGAVHPVDSSMLLILDVRQVDSSFFSNLKEHYEVVLNQENTWLNVQLETFSHHCFIVDQYVLQNERLVQFRLQCRRKDRDAQQPQLEVYFFLNRSNIQNNIKSVESSIGTLNCLN
jgi:hypothetical protein